MPRPHPGADAALGRREGNFVVAPDALLDDGASISSTREPYGGGACLASCRAW